MPAPLLVTNAPRVESSFRGDSTQSNRGTASNGGASFAEVIEKRLNTRDEAEPKTPKEAPSHDNSASKADAASKSDAPGKADAPGKTDEPGKADADSQTDAAGKELDPDSKVEKPKKKEPSKAAQTSPTAGDANASPADGQSDPAETSPQGLSNPGPPNPDGQAAQPQQIPADGGAAATSTSGVSPSLPPGEATRAGGAEVGSIGERVERPLRAAAGAEVTTGAETGKETAKPGGEAFENDLSAAQADPKVAAAINKVEQSLSGIPNHQHGDAGHEAASAVVRGSQAHGVVGSSPTASALTPPSFSAAELPDGLDNQIRWMIKGQSSLAELKLNPAELGSLEVKIAVDKDTTNIHFLVHNAAAKEMVENALPRLRALLGNVGVNLQEVSVSDRNAGEQQQNAQSGFGDGHQQGYGKNDGRSQMEADGGLFAAPVGAISDRMIDAFA